MNKRKCYLVVVTSAKTTTRADCSTCCLPNSPHFSHRHDMILILRDLSQHTIFDKLLGKRSTFPILWSLKPLLRYGMIFPLADQICAKKTPNSSQRLSKWLTRCAKRGLKRANAQRKALARPLARQNDGAEKRKSLRHCPAASNVGSSARSFKMIGILREKNHLCLNSKNKIGSEKMSLV